MSDTITTDHLFLGVDGGASNITVAIIDDRRRVLYEHTEVGGANYHAVGMQQSLEHLEMALQEAAHRLPVPYPVVFEQAVFGLAGCNFPSDERLLMDALRRSSISTMLGKGFQVVNDSRIALRAGSNDGTGIVLIAGTGSNCYGRTADGQEGRAGGVDHILSDEGSGYDIGLRGLRAVVQALDGRGDETALVQTMFDHLHVHSMEEMCAVVYERFAAKPAIASLSRVVGLCAEEGDVVAQDILNHSVNELIRLVDAVLHQLDFGKQPIPVVRVGSVFKQDYLTKRFVAELQRVAPAAQVVGPTMRSAMGAALLALEAASSKAQPVR